jgi:hypothetical protein
MLQTEAYLYDRKLRLQTFIVQATGVEFTTVLFPHNLQIGQLS